LVDIDKFVAGLFLFVLVFAAIFLIAPLLLWLETTMRIAAKADSEAVNGILTVTGILFGLEFAFFKAPKGKARILWVFALLFQAILLASLSFRYVSDTMSYGYLTTNTLLIANFDFAFVLFFTAILAALDLIIQRD